jgi:hypothetical protein
VVPEGKAIRYGAIVGEDGQAWSGVATVARKKEWPGCMPTEGEKRRRYCKFLRTAFILHPEPLSLACSNATPPPAKTLRHPLRRVIKLNEARSV